MSSSRFTLLLAAGLMLSCAVSAGAAALPDAGEHTEAPRSPGADMAAAHENDAPEAGTNAISGTGAAPETAPAERAPVSYISFALGQDNVSQDGNADDFLDIRVELRPSLRLFKYIGPVLALEMTDELSVFFGGGVFLDIRPAAHFYIAPSFVAGKYDRGDGKDLGGSLQFRSQLEAGYTFDNDHRLGVSYSHMSNGGRYDDNPGVEALTLYYHIPLSGL